MKGKVKEVKYAEFDFAIRIMDNVLTSPKSYKQWYDHWVKKKVSFQKFYIPAAGKVSILNNIVPHKREGSCLEIIIANTYISGTVINVQNTVIYLILTTAK